MLVPVRKRAEYVQRSDTPLTIRGKHFRFRTFHSPDCKMMSQSEDRTVDQIYTVTLAAVNGARHRENPHMTVVI